MKKKMIDKLFQKKENFKEIPNEFKRDIRIALKGKQPKTCSFCNDSGCQECIMPNNWSSNKMKNNDCSNCEITHCDDCVAEFKGYNIENCFNLLGEKIVKEGNKYFDKLISIILQADYANSEYRKMLYNLMSLRIVTNSNTKLFKNLVMIYIENSVNEHMDLLSKEIITEADGPIYDELIKDLIEN